MYRRGGTRQFGEHREGLLEGGLQRFVFEGWNGADGRRPFVGIARQPALKAEGIAQWFEDSVRAKEHQDRGVELLVMLPGRRRKMGGGNEQRLNYGL